MEAERIADIEKKLKQAKEEELLALLEKYRQDSRKGVLRLCEQMQKKIEAKKQEKLRTEYLYAFERSFPSEQAVYGMDEVGRGPLAGPVVACALALPRDHMLLHLNDSKKLSATERERLFEILEKEALAIGIGVVSPERIDAINILQATYEAMTIAVSQVKPSPDILLNDAVTVPGISCRQIPIIKGDAKCASIAAASIVAKVTRDKMMEAYDQMYPAYGFASNKGYGSEAHIQALKKLGPSPIHRRSFISHFVEV